MKKISFLFVFLLSAALVWADGPWGTYGSAMAVNTGAPHGWAIKLPSMLSTQYSGAFFQPPNGKLTFGDIYQLSADFSMTIGDCGVGAPRFSIGLDRDGDGKADMNVFVYFGPVPNFTGCGAGWQNTGNLITNTDLRFDSTQLGGSFYGTYSQALALAGTAPVIYVSLDVDGGWNAPQTALVDNVTVNNFVLSAKGLVKK